MKASMVTPHPWIEIDPNSLDLPAEREEVGDVHISILMSPHDIPEAVRGYFDEDSKRFIIELRYLDSEPWRVEERRDDPVRIRLGRHSRRLCGFEVDLDRLDADSVSLVVHGKALPALEELTRHQESGIKKNYSLAREVLEELASRLIPAAEPSGGVALAR